MKFLVIPLSLIAGLLASACVTINVYFPAAAAQAAADRVIDEVWGDAAAPSKPASGDAGKPVSRLRDNSLRWAASALNWVVPAVQAADPDIDVSSPAIRELTQSMEARFSSLKPYLDSGVLGVGHDGFIAIRDANSVPLAQRNQVRKLVANENADRAQLYKEIAAANGQPQWEEQIRQVFAKRWVAKAKAGWQVETADGWKTK